MSLQEVEIKQSYRTSIDNIPKDFYMPLLSRANSYKRAVGYFSSSILSRIYFGIATLANKGGRVQLVASPKLYDEDIEAIRMGYEMRDSILKKAIMREMTEPSTPFEEKCLNQLANLIADGIMDIKIAFTEKDKQVGMYHEKMGLISDLDGNIVAFSGSMNETYAAVSHNFESIDVFCSWKSNEQYERVEDKKAAFTAIWNNNEPSITVLDFPDLSDELIQRYKRETIDRYESYDDEYQEDEIEDDSPQYYPHIPDDVEIRPYQDSAIANWQSQDFIGIFDMATGTGKTYTALAAVAYLYEYIKSGLAVTIVCPYQHLVEQWVYDIEKFGMKPIICYSASQQRNWKQRLKTAVQSFNMGIVAHFCVVSTNATFSSDFVQEQISSLNGNTLLVIDEAHNFGAEKLSRALLPNMRYRIALSATIDRYGDEEGTQKLYEYFGDKCIEYTLKEAIDNGMLTPYFYHPIAVTLNETELHEYLELTRQIVNVFMKRKDKKSTLSEHAKMLLIKRARLVAAASEKIIKLKQEIQPYLNDSHILVYCGATTMKDVDYKDNHPPIDDVRQIVITTDLLGNELGMRVRKFTSEESAEQRESIKKEFAEADHLQALIAIRCLDEGVNIPSIKTAFILASSTNPKEYVQRRGRVLRTYKGKDFARIYDFITLPIPINSLSAYSDAIINSVKSLAIREMVRMKDFASIAENPSEADRLISEIVNAYNITPDDERRNQDV